MTKNQYILIFGSLLLFLVLYFGCDTKNDSQKALEKTRALAAESTDINALLKSAKSDLIPEAENAVFALERQIEEMPDDSTKLGLFQQLSGLWFELGRSGISGYYAQRIAEIDNNENSWSIAGTTYTICVQRSQEEKVKNFCSGRAVTAFENAISINPENMAHKVNLALCYAENPPKDNPMKGVLMLVDLNKQAPENVMVLNSLGRLAIKTGQYDRAIERLTTALENEPENIKTVCLLAQAYEAKGDTENAQAFAEKCQGAQ